MAMIFLMFASGIFWDVCGLDDPAKTKLILAINPVAFTLDAYPQILMYQTPSDPTQLGIIGAVLVVLLAAVLWITQKSSQYLALRALSV